MIWSSSPPSCTEPLRRVQSLKFRSEEQSDLNDILLRVSAFGLFVYAVFSVIAGGMGAFTHEPNLLVMITGCLSVLQVIIIFTNAVFSVTCSLYLQYKLVHNIMERAIKERDGKLR